MTIIAHGLTGGASFVLPWCLCCNRFRRYTEGIVDLRGWFWSLAAAGFVLGSLPDTLDWTLATLGWVDRWAVYGMFHTGTLGICTAWIPPIGLHFALDVWIHSPPGYNWWSDFWWLEVLAWVVSAVILFLSWKCIRKGSP